MKSSSSEHDLVVLSLLKKTKRKWKYWVHPILRLRREEGEFHFIKELRDYPERFKVYFRMSVPQFDALLVILAHSIFIFCLFPYVVCHTVLLQFAVDDVDQLVRWHWGFWRSRMVALNCQNVSQNACHGCEKCRKSNLIWIFLWQTKVSEAVCKRDWHNVRSYLFFNVRTFCMRISDSVYKMICE